MAFNFPLWFLCFPALLGLAFGSFLNVCIVRLPLGMSVVQPRSQCPDCKTQIPAWQNIPALSWLLLRGKCRACAAPIAIFYPLVELAVAIWFIYCALLFHGDFNSAIHAVSTAALGWLLLGLMVMDARDGLLPDAFTLGGGLLGILLLAASTVSLPAETGTVFITLPEKIVLHRLLAIVIAACSLLLLRWLYKLLRHHEGMGLGDVKMTAMLAAFFGLRLTALTFLVACIAGTLYARWTMLRFRSDTKKHSWGERNGTPASVPFGSFLAIGGFYALIAGPATLHWYMQFF